MIKISSRFLLLLASLTWLCVGIFLLSMGLHLVLTSLDSSTEFFSLLSYLMQRLESSKDNALVALIFTAICIGYFKGKFVLKKTAQRQIHHILATSPPLSLTTLYTKKYMLLILSMMTIGMTLRFLPIHSDLRGFIDIAVGTALIQGATHYFPIIRKRTEPQS